MTDPIFSEPAYCSCAVRVVRNKLPALQPGGHDEISGGLMDRRMTGTGFHEVLIEHRDHNRYLYDQTKEEMKRVLSALQCRYIQIGRDERISLVVIFKNHGAGAGASLEHPHCQILA